MIILGFLKNINFSVKTFVPTFWQLLENFGHLFIPTFGHTVCNHNIGSRMWRHQLASIRDFHLPNPFLVESSSRRMSFTSRSLCFLLHCVFVGDGAPYHPGQARRGLQPWPRYSVAESKSNIAVTTTTTTTSCIFNLFCRFKIIIFFFFLHFEFYWYLLIASKGR